MVCAKTGVDGFRTMRIKTGEREVAMEAVRGIPVVIERRRRVWARSASLHQVAGVALSTIGVLSGLLVATLGETLGMPTTQVLGFVGAGCAGIMGTLKPHTMGTRFRRAWRELDEACIRYETDASLNEAHLCDALARGERKIGDLDG